MFNRNMMDDCGSNGCLDKHKPSASILSCIATNLNTGARFILYAASTLLTLLCVCVSVCVCVCVCVCLCVCFKSGVIDVCS